MEALRFGTPSSLPGRPGDEWPAILVTRIAWHLDAGRPPLEIELEEYFGAVSDG